MSEQRDPMSRWDRPLKVVGSMIGCVVTGVIALAFFAPQLLPVGGLAGTVVTLIILVAFFASIRDSR